LARALAARDDLAPQLSIARGSEWFERTADLDLPMHVVDTYSNIPTALMSSFRLPGIAVGFRKFLESQGIAAVVSTMRGPWTTPMLPAIKRSGVGLISIVHDAEPHLGERAPLFRWAQRREIAASVGAIALSDHVARQVIATGLLPHHRVWRMAHGALPPSPRSMRPASSSAAMPGRRLFRLVFAGRIEPYKDLGLLVEAVIEAQRRVPIALTIAGSGRLAVASDRLAAIEDLTVDNRWLDDDALDRHVTGADALILPYREASQSGVVALAFAAGVPAIVTPVGGLVEQVRHGKSGLIATSTEPSALAEAIVRLASDPKLHDRCARGARDTANSEMSWERSAAVVATAVQSVVGGPHGQLSRA
jgi:glycosyltransferase involved in cell wall biosynthesis